MINDTENRNFLRELIESNVTKKLIPKGLGWFGCMGGLSLLAFMMQLGTGIFLMFYFIPSAREALASIQYMSHMLRILFKGIYRHPRELHWISGACLLILTLLMYYTGSLLSAHNISDNSTMNLTFLYAIHLAGIPVVMAIFMGMHFFMVRKTGIYEPL